ncbi:uncharacterized protein LOC123880100 [Maniola jurtina]|uniref:uncharacterized protein LOC123880100 n=1 Tax=Maniola jurtina TaxID=191418 RepID=UPI001E68760A|nr:uncharacterized protein LOC123880100 [Maniola jurtina]
MWVSNGVVSNGGHRVEPVSDVAVVDERAIAAALPPSHIETINVTKSSKVHVGTKVVSITQNVHNKEMLKGRFLGLELVSTKHARRLRCSVAVFVCWAFLVASGLILYLIYIALPKETRQDIGLNETWYLRRDEWMAMPSYGEDFLRLPVGHVVIGHSAANYCNQRYRCVEQILVIQADHMRRGFADIGPNFLVGGNGYVFEGRGANVFGAMVTSWNRRSISIMFLGNYVNNRPDEAQFNHTIILLDTLVNEGVLRPDYILFGQCQLVPLTVSPGPHLVAELKRFSHWNDSGIEGCLPAYLPLPLYLWNIIKNSSRTERLSCGAALVALLVCITLIVYFSVKSSKASGFGDRPPHEWNITRDMWLAQPYNHTQIANNMSPVMLAIIQHTVSSQCTGYSQCAAELRNIQGYYIKDMDYDIPYNFLIGNDGRVYEGRGWNIEGAHTFGYNRCSLGIGFIGDYREEIPNHARVTASQLNRTRMMFDEGVRRGFLRPDFKVVGAKDLRDTASPGSNLYNAIRKWDNYDHQNRFVGMNCEQIQDKYGNVEL